MPQVKEDTTPLALKPFTFFGVEIAYENGKDQSIGRCPFCDVEQKFYVNNKTGQWDCKRGCGDGNVYTFMKMVWENGDWIEAKAEELAEDRRLSVNTLKKWELIIDKGTEDWLVVGYNAEGKLSNLYRRLWNHLEKRWYLNGPKGIQHGLFGMHLWEQQKDDVFLCEGLWDGMSLYELLVSTKSENGELLSTSNPDLALYSNANVLAVPSANVFNEYWTPLFSGKRVYLCYDNDHPAPKTGICGALEGMRRVANILLTSADPPKEVHYLKWGEVASKNGYVGYDPNRKHGYDLRDLLTSADDASDRRAALQELFTLLEPVPPSWIEGAKGSKGKPIIGTLECKTYAEALEACRTALNMIPQMERGLANMLAVSSLVEIGGDQLWMKFIGPPSSGKTTLADGLILARKYACMKSITTGLHSGYREKEDEGDYSLINFIKNMAVIVKDGDTLLQAENLGRILSELRDAYDRNSSTHFRNKVMREYLNHSFALLLFGTEAIRILDQSELGQRFIDCVMMDKIPVGHETRTNVKIANSFYELLGSQASLNGDGIESKDLLEAKQKIGGLLEHLRRNAKHIISEIRPPDKYTLKIDDIAQFTATFRARPSTMQTEKYTVELSHRLMKQFIKLGYGLCMVLGKKDFDDDILYRIACCGLDTARGDTLKIAKCLYDSIKRSKVTEGRGKNRKTRIVTTEGLDMATLSQKANMETRELKKLLVFMRGIGTIETNVNKNKVGIGSRLLKWCLTPTAKKLYHSVTSMGEQK